MAYLDASHLRVWTAALALGCGPSVADPADEGGASGDTSGSTTPGASASSTTGESSGSDTVDDWGEEQGGETTSDQNPCDELLTLDACHAGAGVDDQDRCVWVDVYTVGVEADSCELLGPVGRCIYAQYQGDGCEWPGACGDSEAAPVYWRGNEDGFVELFQYDLCENQPMVGGWDYCRWVGGEDGGSGGEAEPPECGCVCA